MPDHQLSRLAARGDHITPPGIEVPTRQPVADPDPSLPTNQPPLTEVDVDVDDFIAVAQGDSNSLQEVRSKLLHAIDQVFRPNDEEDGDIRAEPVSIKKLNKGDASLRTAHTILGWEVDTLAKTITLPIHRQQRLRDILDSIPPPHQQRIGITKWHQVLGELRSMALALPGSCGLFSFLQEALRQCKGKCVSLTADVHQALDNFRWIVDNICDRPTRIAELIPLLPLALGFHDASGRGAGGVWYPAQGVVPRGLSS